MKWIDIIDAAVREVPKAKWWDWSILPGHAKHCLKTGEKMAPAERDTGGWQRAVVEWVILHEHLRNLKESA